MIGWLVDGWFALETLTVEEADWKVSGEEDFSWFGYSLHGVTVANRTLLLVGSPTWKNVSRSALIGIWGNTAHRGRCQLLWGSIKCGVQRKG